MIVTKKKFEKYQREIQFFINDAERRIDNLSESFVIVSSLYHQLRKDLDELALTASSHNKALSRINKILLPERFRMSFLCKNIKRGKKGKNGFRLPVKKEKKK